MVCLWAGTRARTFDLGASSGPDISVRDASVSLFWQFQVENPYDFLRAYFKPTDAGAPRIWSETADWIGTRGFGIGARREGKLDADQWIDRVGVAFPTWVLIVWPTVALGLQTASWLPEKSRRVEKICRVLRVAAGAMSLLVGLTLVAIWIRSYWRYDSVLYECDEDVARSVHYNYWIRNGKFACYYDQIQIEYRLVSENGLWLWHSGRVFTVVQPSDVVASFAGFRMFRLHPNWKPNVEIPLWIPTLFPFLAATWIFRGTRKRTFPPGSCASCGYDLRAHKVGDKCPECASVVDRSA
jgi:hypothetical protein